MCSYECEVKIPYECEGNRMRKFRMSAKVTECARNARLETDYRADSWKCVPGYARG